MNKRTLFVIFALSIAAVACTLVPYATHFGRISSEHGRWGEFGDYVGGILNPFFALAAFLAALYSIFLQGEEIRRNEERSQRESLARDMLAVMRTIDERVADLLRTHVGVVTTDSLPRRTIELDFNHMLAEAQRIDLGMEPSRGFQAFVEAGKVEGSTIEATVRALLELVLRMQSFVVEFESISSQSRSPFLAYYAVNMANLCILLQNFGLTAKSEEYFKSVASRHGDCE